MIGLNLLTKTTNEAQRNARFALRMSTVLALGALVSGCAVGDRKFVDFSNGFIAGSEQYIDQNPTTAAPVSANGVIDNGNFKTIRAVAGDSMASLAARAGVTTAALASHNGVAFDYTPKIGQEFIIPNNAIAADIADPNAPTADGIQVASLGNVDPSTLTRHRVEPGQTAYTIAQLYGVSVAKLAEWNGLGADLAVFPGQELIIPPRADASPSTSTPTETASTAPVATTTTASSGSGGFSKPVSGSVKTGFDPANDQDGYIYSTASGASVNAAGAGKVVLISESTGPQGTILMIQHPNGLISVYGRLGQVNVAKGTEVSAGQNIGTTAGGELMFQFRRGTAAVDPAQYI